MDRFTWQDAVYIFQIALWAFLSFYWQQRALKAEKLVQQRNRREALNVIKAAIDGKRVYVVQAPEGMTLLEAQQHIDAALGPFYPKKGDKN